MKLLKSMLAAFAVAMLVCGCSKSALDYVPEDAAIVGYANTKALFDSKIWKVLEENKEFEKEFIKNAVKELKLDEITDISGNLAVWSTGFDAETGEPEDVRAVLILDDNNAEDVFDVIFRGMKKEFADSEYTEVKKEDVDDAENAFCVRSSDKKRYKLSVVLVNKKTIYFIIGDEPEALEKDKKSDIAKSINKDAVLAIATSGSEWSDFAKVMDMEDTIENIGVAKIEVFCTKKEIKVSATVDISDVEIDD